jgi:hypothetical protein
MTASLHLQDTTSSVIIFVGGAWQKTDFIGMKKHLNPHTVSRGCKCPSIDVLSLSSDLRKFPVNVSPTGGVEATGGQGKCLTNKAEKRDAPITPS